LNGRVLVVDDEAIIRNFLADGLTDAGYQVMTARDGAEAIQSVHQYQPDAVLLDLVMPVADGWAFLRERRVQPAVAIVPVVVFSAAGKEGIRDASALRATAVLTKPLDLDVLVTVLQHVLSDARKYPADATVLEAAQAIPVLDPAAAVPVLDAPVAPGLEMAPSVPGGLDVGADGQPPGRRIGTCPICSIALYARLDDSLAVPARIRAIHAVRRAHILSHSATDIAGVPLRTRLLQMPLGQRRILAQWVDAELRHHWGDADRLGVHSVDEALGSVAMHRLWQDAVRCVYPSCHHGL
jgi:CheY-like chemotaxis protein